MVIYFDPKTQHPLKNSLHFMTNSSKEYATIWTLFLSLSPPPPPSLNTPESETNAAASVGV